MKKILKDCALQNPWFDVFGLASIGLIITSFIVPPTGTIDPSVLAATGELFAFAALGTVLKALDKGVDAKITRGDTTLAVGSNDDNASDSEVSTK